MDFCPARRNENVSATVKKDAPHGRFGKAAWFSRMMKTRPQVGWIVIVLTLTAFALRVYRLDAQSMWWDELAPVLIAQLPFPDWLVPVFQDRGHPPGLYFYLSLWTQLGAGEFFVRYLSAFLGTLSVAIVARLGARVGGARVGIIAAGLMALSPFYIWYAQESRMYAPLIFAAVASSWAFVELLHAPQPRVALGLFLADVFGLYIHYLFGLVLLAQLLFMVFGRGRYARARRLWIAATFSAGLAFLPWLIALQLTPIRGRPNLEWIPNAQWFDPALSLSAALLGAAQEPSFVFNWLPSLLALALAIYGAAVYRKTKARENVRYLLFWLLAPWLFLFLVSLPIPQRALYVDRYLTPFVPAFLLLVALGASALWQFKRAVFGIVAVMALLPMLLALANMYFEPRYARDDWRGVSAYLRQNVDAAHDALVFDLSQALPFDYYLRGDLSKLERPLGEENAFASWIQAQPDLRTRAHLWLLTTAIPINIHRFYPDETGQRAFARRDPFKRAMDAQFVVEREEWFPGLLLTRYRVEP